NRLWSRLAMSYLCTNKAILEGIRVLRFSIKEKTPLFSYPKFINCFNSEYLIKSVKQSFKFFDYRLIDDIHSSIIFQKSLGPFHPRSNLKSLAMNEYCLGYKNSSIHNAILSTHSNSLKHLGYCVINDYSSLMGLISKCKNLEMLEVTQQENHEKTIRRGLHASRKSHQALLPSYITKDIMDTMERHNSGLTRLNISMRSNHILDLIHLIGGWSPLNIFTLELEDEWPILDHELIKDSFLRECAKVGFDAYSSRRFGLLKGLVGHFNHLRKVKSKKGIPGLNGLVE
ncbi:6794_t:CDS:2, partial [Funneliformis mosseae]